MSQTQRQFESVPVNQCFKIQGISSVTFRKVLTSLGNKLWDEAEQKSYNAIVIWSSCSTLPVGWTCTMNPGEMVRPVQDPETVRKNRNASARARNQILRNTCGTSARAAKEDMGL